MTKLPGKIAYAVKEPSLATRIETILAEDGYDVAAFSTASSLGAFFKDHQSRIVLTEATFSDGYDLKQLCNHIRGNYMYPYVYILALSRSGTISDIEEAIAAGVDDYLIEPFNPLQIRARVRIARKWIDYLDGFLPTHPQ